MRTLTRTLQRNRRRHNRHLTPSWLNDEQFEILETGVLSEENPQPDDFAHSLDRA